ncbi:hypothetical protein F511_22054 [Dorcoceras hygrometricum]|uniref:Uncharacterized protein n=1 Tax=Dorcoceras hygrometricum TaxID=472368 RepID=A0A2Z7C633_9LAMI|nr:hypothetical protein F511_22054 [Dorcoceras hygrometricum]
MPPRDRRTEAARRRPPPAQRAAHCRKLRAARPAIGTVAVRSYSAAAPGSDQIHRESGTSTVGGGRSPNPVHDWKQDSSVIGTSPITASGGGGRERRGGEGWAAVGG